MTAFYNDNDAGVCEWTRNLIQAGLVPEGVVDERSIQEIKARDLEGYIWCSFFNGIAGWPIALRLAGFSPARPVWCASLPCQPFSTAGKRKGQADKRHLWPVFFRLVRECQPATIFGEQVASDDGYRWLARVRDDLESAGYAVGCADLPAACAGSPHIRQRLFWVAQSMRERQRRPAPGNHPGSTAKNGESAQQAGERGKTCGLAQSNGRGLGECLQSNGDQERGQSAPRRPDTGGRDVPCGVGHSNGSRESTLARIPGGTGVECSGSSCRVEHPARDGRGQRDQNQRGGDGGVCAEGNGSGSADNGKSCRVGFAHPARCPQHGGTVPDGEEQSVSECASDFGWLDDSAGQRAGISGEALASGDGPHDGISGPAGAERHYGVSHPASLLGSGGSDQQERRPQGRIPDRRPGAWDDFGLVPCRDGKARRVESGNEPLAHGIPSRNDPRLGFLLSRLEQLGHGPKAARRILREARSNRVSRLRGYGNAIVIQVAALFIRAYLDAEETA